MKKKLKILVLLLALGLQAYGQAVKITGTVSDDAGLPLPGATVSVIGSKSGAITDDKGKYTIGANVGDQIKFTFTSFKEQIKTVGKSSVINVKLNADVTVLDDVLVVAYATQKKSTAVGSVAQASGESLKRQGSVTSITDALQGAIPGVTILPNTGVPGGGQRDKRGSNFSETDILIRGKATWNSTSPLILVDGVERSMNDININEIATISVLKDASATAVFGMKGGNGVILITTQRGTKGKSKLTAEFNQTFENLSKYSYNVGTYEGFRARNLAVINSVDVRPTAWDFFIPNNELELYRNQSLPFAFANNDWKEIMTKDFASSQNLNLKVQGGNDFVKYFASLSYLNQGDIFRTADLGQGYDPSFNYKRFNFRANLDFNLTSTTQFVVSLAGVYGRQKQSGAGTTSVFTAFSGHAPEVPVVQYEDGVWGTSSLYAIVGSNEYANLNLSGTEVENKTDLNTDFSLVQKLDVITKGLSAKAKVAFDNSFYTLGREVSPAGYISKDIRPDFYLRGGYYDYNLKSYIFNGEPISTASMIDQGLVIYSFPTADISGFTVQPAPNDFKNEEIDAGGIRTSFYYEGSLNYNRKFGKHNVTALGLFSRQIVQTGGGWPQKREDWVSRVTYGFNEKYFGEVNGTYNGSEKFGPGNKFDFFPSFALGWNIAKEKIVKENVTFMNNFKLKYSFGIVGNDRISGQQWGYTTLWNKGSAWDGTNVVKANFGRPSFDAGDKYYEGTPGNPDLRWEKAEKQNIGAEFGFFKNSLTAAVDFYKEHRYDMLISGGDRTVPSSYGQRPASVNLGIVDNSGFELEAAYTKSFDSGLSFTIGGNYTRATNKIIVKDDPELQPYYQKEAGYSISQPRITQQSGFIQSYDDLYNGVGNVDSNTNIETLPGDFRMIDFNADGIINQFDSMPYGFPVYPESTYSANFNLSYKGWSFGCSFYGTRNVTREATYVSFFGNSSLIQPFYIEDTWLPAYGNENPTYPGLKIVRGGTGAGTYNHYDGSLIRLRSAEISYTLPKKWSSIFGSSQTKIFANGNNLYLWTDVPADGEGRNLESRNYPLKRSVTVGANIQF